MHSSQEIYETLLNILLLKCRTAGVRLWYIACRSNLNEGVQRLVNVPQQWSLRMEENIQYLTVEY